MAGSDTWSQLTTDQQNEYIAFMALLRSNCIQFAKLLNQMAANDSIWKSNISAIDALLQAGTVIPDDTGLAGASSLTNTDAETYVGAIEAILAAYNITAYRNFFVRACGPANTTLTT